MQSCHQTNAVVAPSLSRMSLMRRHARTGYFPNHDYDYDYAYDYPRFPDVATQSFRLKHVARTSLLHLYLPSLRLRRPLVVALLRLGGLSQSQASLSHTLPLSRASGRLHPSRSPKSR